MGGKRGSPIERFLPKVRVDSSGCHLWLGSSHKQGSIQQAMFFDGVNNTPAYRWYYQYLHKTQLPRYIFVCHTCDNEMCVNPDHLFLGTHQDNMADMVIKGRTLKGENRYNAKLTEMQVRVIKEALAAGHKGNAIARYFNVVDATVYAIKNGNTWVHVTI